MSHDATNWASKQRGIKPALKVVLWHLCDCYNPENGCFPSQDYLVEHCEVPRSTLNVYLGELERHGLIVREQRRKKGSMHQERTRYYFPFDPEFERKRAQNPCPEAGHGDVEPESENGAEPSPENSESRVQNLDSNPVREPVREPVIEREGAREIEDRKDLERRYKALEIGTKRNPWPNVLKSSTKWGFDQFLKLSPEDRRLAEERRDDYLAACPKVKSGERKGEPDAAPLGVYLRDRKFVDVAAVAPRRVVAETVNVAPFGPVWAGLRMLPLLAGPVSVDMPEDARVTARNMFEALKRTSEQRANSYLARKGIRLDGDDLVFPDDFEDAEYRRCVLDSGYPETKRLNNLAASWGAEKAESWCAIFSELCEAVPVGSEMYRRWRDHHAAMNWPFVPDPGSMRVVYFPKGGPEGLYEFETAARAAMAEGAEK